MESVDFFCELDLLFFIFRPFDIDDSLFIYEQLSDVFTSFVVNDDAFAERDIADDRLAAKRIAAARAVDQQLIMPLNLERVAAGGAASGFLR